MNERDLRRFIKIPTLTTERLVLRQLLRSDVDDVFAYASDPLVSKYLLWSPHKTKAYTAAYLSLLQKKYRLKQFFDWGVEYEGKIIGTVGFTTLSPENNFGEIGYVLSSRYWGKRIAAEALSRVLEYGFCELSLNRIEARFMVENERSRAVLSRCGMSYEGVLRGAVFAKGVYRDVEIHSILREEYLKGK